MGARLHRAADLIVSEAVVSLIAAARKKLASDPEESLRFDAIVWDIRALNDRSSNPANPRIYFTRHGSLKDPLPPEFAAVVKSWIILERHSSKNMARRVDAVRMLWEAILARRESAEGFQWESLCDEDLSQTELLMRTRWSDSTVYKQMISVIVFGGFLAARGICPALSYTPQTPRAEDFNRHTIEGQEARRDRLPTSAALAALADVYREHATEPRDRLRILAVAILVVSGFRIGELLTLPCDCEVEETRSGKPRYGLRYFREKCSGGEKLFAVRWLTPIGAELARQAIREIRAITDPARARARVLEGCGHRVPMPGHHWAARMTTAEVRQALGHRNLSSAIPRHRDRRGGFFRAHEVENYLRSIRVQHLWSVDQRNGKFQRLSETLFIAFRNFFHPQRSDCPLLVEPLAIAHLSDFLSGRPGVKSIFHRLNFREPDGSFCCITTHQFRHWLNYIADKGGLPIDLQTRWLGREHPRDTEAYRHATVDERLAWVKEGIRSAQLSGAKADVYFGLPLAERDVFLEAEIQAVHVTAFGLCLHDFAVTPCPYHLNCIRGCADYLRTKGNPRERLHLVQIQQATEMALAAAKKRGGIAQAWIIHCEETLAGVSRALAVDGHAASPKDDVASALAAGSRNDG